MKKIWKKHRKLLIVIGLLLAAAAIVWASTQGQANAKSQDLGGKSIKSLKVSTNLTSKAGPTEKKASKSKRGGGGLKCDWGLYRSLKAKIEAKQSQIDGLIAKADREKSGSGIVPAGTKQALTTAAQDYKSLQYQMAKMWRGCNQNCSTKAREAEEAGNLMVASVDVAIADEPDDQKLDTLNASQKSYQGARREMVNEAVQYDEVDDQDRQAVKANVIPQVRGLISEVQTFVREVTGLMGEIQKSLTPSGGLGMLTKAVTTGSNPALDLLNRVKYVLTGGKSLLGNVRGLMMDAQSVVSGSAAGPGAAPGTGSKMSPCFIGTTEP